MADNSAEINQQQVNVTINKPTKVLHFSDGVDEEIEEQHMEQLSSQPFEETVDTKQLDWAPWFTYYAWKSTNKILNAVDIAGEGLASFFGITTPKYQIEIDEYNRLQEEKKKIEEDSQGWVPSTAGGDIPLVLNEPVKAVHKDAV